jgi:hypothetical protein
MDREIDPTKLVSRTPIALVASTETLKKTLVVTSVGGLITHLSSVATTAAFTLKMFDKSEVNPGDVA